MNTDNKMEFQEPKPVYGEQMKKEMCTHECTKLKERIVQLEKENAELLQKTKDLNYYLTSSSLTAYEERSKNWRDNYVARQPTSKYSDPAGLGATSKFVPSHPIGYSVP
jgi:hypothetical protein